MFCEEIKHRMCYTVYKLTAAIALNVIKKEVESRTSQKHECINRRISYLNKYICKLANTSLTELLSISHVTCR